MPVVGSGVTVMDDCVKEFENMKKSRAYYGIVHKLSQDLKFIEVDKKFENPTGEETDTTVEEYQKFANYLLAMEEEKDCRYACYDVRFTTGEGVRRNKLVFITFCPENAKIKHKMVYSSSKDTLKSKLIGILDVQANDASDLALDNIVSKAQSNTTYGWAEVARGRGGRRKRRSGIRLLSRAFRT